MQYRPLGRTGLNVSILSYGASPLGSVFRDIKQDQGIAAVHRALDLGINFIDVSPYYGLTKAETVLGMALRDIPRDRYILATKVGRYGNDLFDFSAKRVTQSVDESLKRLGVDHVDLIQCHDIEFVDLNQVIDETIPALQRVIRQGKARCLGITGLPLKIFRTVIDRVEPGTIDTILSYCRYSLNDHSLESLLPYCRDHGVGVINASPLSMGLLSDCGAPAWHPAATEIQSACAKAAAFCREQGEDIAKLALQFAVRNPDIATTLCGTASRENVEKNVQWIEQPLDEDLLAEVLKILEPIRHQTWPSGRGENQD